MAKLTFKPPIAKDNEGFGHFKPEQQSLNNKETIQFNISFSDDEIINTLWK